MRLDKWLWSARFYRTRSLAADTISKGRVHLNGMAVKPARSVRIGDLISLQQGQKQLQVQVLGLNDQRGPACLAQQLYTETPASAKDRQRQALQRQLAPEPAETLTHGRPTKRERRQLNHLYHWNDHWSPAIEPPPPSDRLKAFFALDSKVCAGQVS